MSKILITGADGMLGSYINFGLKTSKETLDISDLKACRDFLKQNKPKEVLHLAALTDLDLCESNPDLAYKINSVGTYNIALASHEVGAKLIYISTNAVFDGTKKGSYSIGDTPSPTNTYGHSKYLGELTVLGLNPKNLVVRTSWIFGGGPKKDKKFVSKIFTKLIDNESVKAVNDVYGTPTYGKDLAKKLKELIEKDFSGIVHAVNGGEASRLNMVQVMKNVLKSKSEITGVPLSSFGNLSNTLRNETLNAGKHTLQPWQEALKEYLETEWKNITQ